MASNFIKLNVDKTKMLLIRSALRHSEAWSSNGFPWGSCLYPFYHMCFLGATTASRLSFEAHINHIIKGSSYNSSDEIQRSHHIGSHVVLFDVVLLIHVLSCGHNYCCALFRVLRGIFALHPDWTREILFRFKLSCLIIRMNWILTMRSVSFLLGTLLSESPQVKKLGNHKKH